MNETTRQNIIDLLSRYANPKLKAGDIPAKWKKNIASKFDTPPDDEWLGFLNLAFLMAGKDGILFAKSGIWMRYAGHEAYLTWARLADAGAIQLLPKNRISVGDRYTLYTLDGHLPAPELAQLLIGLQDLMIETKAADSCWEYDEHGFAADELYTRYACKARADYIRDVCREYAGYPYLPPFKPKVNQYIADGFCITQDDEILAYLDFNVVINAQEGIVVTKNGLYWKSKLRERCLTWEDLYAMSWPELQGDNLLALDSQLMTLNGSKLHQEEIAELLRRILSLRPRDVEFKARVFPRDREDQLSDDEKQLVIDKYAIRNICRRHNLLSHPTYYPPVDEPYESDDELVIARNILAHTTSVTGFYVTTRGIRFRNDTYNKQFMPLSFIPFARLVGAEISIGPSNALFVDSWLVCKSDLCEEIAHLIGWLQLYCASLQANDAPPLLEKEAVYMDPWPIPVKGEPTDRHWVVAEEGVIRGIWPTIELAYARDHQLMEASVISVWSAGMDGWAALEEIELTDH